MNRVGRAGLALGLLALLGAVQAQEATVVYRDRVARKSVDVKGVIEEEDFAGIKIKGDRDRETKQIPGRDVERVLYKTKDVDPITYRDPFNKEDKGLRASAKTRGELLEQALAGYRKLEREVKNPPAARRYFRYKMAEVAVAQARFDPARTDEAVKSLIEFKTNHREGWELVLALETLARIHEEGGKVEEARKAYEELAELPGAPDSVKQQSGVLVGKLFLRGGQFKEAEGRLARVVEAMSAGDADRPLAQAYLIESRIGQDKLGTAEKELTGLIRGSPDARLRGVAYALLGDCQMKKGRPAEAFWSYLRVDAQYSDDADAHARALFRLATLFDREKKEPLRGKECLNRLLDKRFDGSPYQKRAREALRKE